MAGFFKKILKENILPYTEHYILRLKEIIKNTFSPELKHRAVSMLAWRNIEERFKKARDVLFNFTKTHTKVAFFVYVCLFCSFSINFIDKAFAKARFSSYPNNIFEALSSFNPSGWWFVILIFMWLVYMAIAGLSLTTEAFEQNIIKSKRVAFVLFVLTLSSSLTLILNVSVGRYTPESFKVFHVFGFDPFRFQLFSTSFPDFGTQSIWAVFMATAFFFPRFKKILFGLATFVTFCLIMTPVCYISDAVMGGYIGVMMFYVARWILSERGGNNPLISL